MRIQLSCHKCTDSIASGEADTVYARLCTMSDSGTYEMECPKGHRSTIVLHTPKHELLYLIGANALLDGYNRDAVVSFTGAMERYFEFALRVLAWERKIDSKDFESAWNVISKQSERQLDGIIAVWLFESGNCFVEVPFGQIQSKAEFRNSVVHKGAIPVREKCIAYGQHVADVIAPIERHLLAKYPKAHKDVCFSLARKVAAETASPITVLSEFSVLSAMIAEAVSLETILPRLEAHRSRLGIASLPRDLVVPSTVVKNPTK